VLAHSCLRTPAPTALPTLWSAPCPAQVAVIQPYFSHEDKRVVGAVVALTVVVFVFGVATLAKILMRCRRAASVGRLVAGGYSSSAAVPV
jgi:hypothetical protein